MMHALRARNARTRPLLLAPAACAAIALFVSAAPASADQQISTPQAPVVVIHSTSGLVTVVRGDDGFVRVTGASNATATTFVTGGAGQAQGQPQGQGQGQGMLLPRDLGFPSRRFTIPGVRAGTLGVRIDNPGGDATVYVPSRVAAVLIKLDDGDASLTGFRGPYVVVTNGGSVDLRSLFGFGHIRTTTGRVTMTGVGGNLRVETISGSVMGTNMLTERAEVRSQQGDIDWTFARLAGGPYRFTSGAGNLRIALNGSEAANIDAQSTQGSVIDRFGRATDVRFRSQHAVSLNLRGGGPEISAVSQSGIVVIAPRSRPLR